MSEAPPPLKGVTVGLVLVGFSVPLLWLLFVWATLSILFEGLVLLDSWSWDLLCILWPALLVVQMVGHLLCLRVPRDWRTRGSEVAALSLCLLQLGLSLVVLLGPWLGQPSAGTARLVVVFLWVLRLVTPGVHLIFLTNFAPRVGQEELASRAETLIQFLFLLPIVPLLVFLGFWLVPQLTNMSFPVMVMAAHLEVVVMVILVGLGFVVELLVLMRFTHLHLLAYHGIFRHQEAFAEKAKLEKAGWVDEPRP
ncbi:MAG: hypothetical protein L0Z62_44520 [Gemmataceae bacterium]|nr:hypothetical protein [Gemmataceae bacterium]